MQEELTGLGFGPALGRERERKRKWGDIINLEKYRKKTFQ